MTFQELDAQLGNGWHCQAVSTLTPGAVRLKLSHDWGDCLIRDVEAKTLEAAIALAITFTHQYTPADYFNVPDWAEDDESWRTLGDTLQRSAEQLMEEPK